MRFNRLKKILICGTLAAGVLLQGVSSVTAYADETVEGEEAADETGDTGEAEGEEEDQTAEDSAAEISGDAVTPGTIIANNGLYIANTFPDSLLPSGFRKQTVAYQGQNIELAYMDASNGLVSLAYLTDASGEIGDFYLCDTATAQMSDYVRFEGGNDRFMIVLDPGNIKAPDGFTATALSVNGKSVTAWIYTGETSGGTDDKEGDDEGKGLFGLFGALKPVKAYAGELDLGIGVGAGSEEGTGSAVTTDTGASDTGDLNTETPDVSVDEGAETSYDTSAPAASGANAAASEYFLVYGIDQEGNQGFYLYDSVGQTYQRYVDLAAGNLEKLASAEKSAKIRLFIIAGLAVLLLVLIIILINMALSGGRRADDYYDDDDDYEEMKRRVEKKSKRASVKTNSRDDYDDYDDDDYDDDDDDDEDVKVYNRKSELTRREAPVKTATEDRVQPAPKKRAPSQDIDLDDDFSFDFIKR